MTALAITEKDFQDRVIAEARIRGWRLYHTRDSRGSDPGFPDLVLVRPPRVIFAELKTEKGKPSFDQLVWLDELNRCDGVETHLFRPSDADLISRVLR